MYYTLSDNKGNFIGVSYDKEGKRVFFKTDDFKKAFKTQDFKTLRWFSDKYQNKNNEWGEGLF
jgi:hypothetical protein